MGNETSEQRAPTPAPQNGETQPARPSCPGPGEEGCLVTDAAGVIREANQAAADMLQARREFLVGKPLGLFVTEEFRPAFYGRLARRRHLDGAEMFQTRLSRGRGGRADVVVTLSSGDWEEHGTACYRWLLRDISDLQRVEQALYSERLLLDSVIGAAQAIILVLDTDGHILRSNPYLHVVTGFDPHELHGRNWYDVLLYPEQRPALRRLIIQATVRGVAKSGVVPLLTRAGSRREVIWAARGLQAGVAGAAVLVGHDVTDLQDAQRQALQTERLATIGQVAAGLAHEGRNALQRIQACLSLVALRSRDNPEALDLLNRAQQAQDDLQHLFEDVRSYSVNLEPRPVAADLAAVWREAWADVTALRGQGTAELREETTETDRTCHIDPFQIKRVFRNLFENALGAAADPVRVVVRCRAASLGDRPALEASVRDNGPGFAPAQRGRLFEPFFTTKTHGTGLGLAICQRIVQAHGGRIEAGEAGPGAEIIIALPRRMS